MQALTIFHKSQVVFGIEIPKNTYVSGNSYYPIVTHQTGESFLTIARYNQEVVEGGNEMSFTPETISDEDMLAFKQWCESCNLIFAPPQYFLLVLP